MSDSELTPKSSKTAVKRGTLLTSTCRQMLSWEEGVDFKIAKESKEVPYPMVQGAKMIATRNNKHSKTPSMSQ